MLRQPPVYPAAQPAWYQCRTLELAVTLLVKPEEDFSVRTSNASRRNAPPNSCGCGNTMSQRSLLKVGDNNLSPFSAAFPETFRHCPGLDPLATTTQKVRTQETELIRWPGLARPPVSSSAFYPTPNISMLRRDQGKYLPR